jgi:hypothetical protein
LIPTSRRQQRPDAGGRRSTRIATEQPPPKQVQARTYRPAARLLTKADKARTTQLFVRKEEKAKIRRNDTYDVILWRSGRAPKRSISVPSPFFVNHWE